MAGVSHEEPPPFARPAVRPVSMRRRVLATASLVLVPLGLVVVLGGFVVGFPQLLLAMLALVAAGFAAWAAMGRRGIVRFAWGVVLVGLLVAAVVLAVRADRSLAIIVLGVGIVVLGGSAAGTALLHAPRIGGPPPAEPVTAPAERAVLFVNPRSGDGCAERVGLVAEARARGVDVVELTEGVDLVAAVREAVAGGADCLGAAGGDGTLAVVAEAAVEHGLPFIVIPAGTRNHFALDLGLDRGDPVAGLDAFVQAAERSIDVAEVNGRMFLNNVSLGAYGEVVAEEQYRQRKVGTALAKLPSIIGPDAEPLDLRFTDGEGERHDSAIVVHVSNNAYELVPRRGFGTRPSLCDGRLGVVAMVSSPGFGGPVSVLRWQAETLVVESSEPVAAGLDGEALELEPPLRFGIRPAALRVWLPVHAIGASPAGRRPRLTKRTVERVRDLALGHIPRY